MTCCNQVLLYLLIYRIGEIGAGGRGTFPIINIIQTDTLIDSLCICHSLIILGLGNKFQIQHCIQTFFPTLGIVLGVPDGIVIGRILGNTSDYRTLGQGQLATGLAEITLGCGFHTQGILSQVNSIHVSYQYLILGKLLGNFQGQVLFLDFTLDFLNHIFAFGGPFRENGILQKLLGNGTGTLRLFTAGLNKLECGTEHTLHINTVMLVETFILNGHKGLAQMVGNLVHGHMDTVRIGTHILIQLVAFAVVYDGGLTGSNHIT